MTDRLWSKYKLVLPGAEVALMGAARTKRVIEAWAQESGMLNVENREVRALYEGDRDLLTYTIEIDSAGWTGINSP